MDGQRCYGIARTSGFKFLEDKGVNEPGRTRICDIVKKQHIGEEDVAKTFLKPDQMKKSKQRRAVIFKRTVIRRDIRKKIDKGMPNVLFVFVTWN